VGQLELHAHAVARHAEHGARGVLHHAIGVDEARRIDDAEPVADRERHAERQRDHDLGVATERVLVRATRGRKRGPLHDQSTVQRRRSDREPQPRGALQIVLVLAKRQVADRARVVAPRCHRPAARQPDDQRGRHRGLVVVVVGRELVGAVLHRDLEAERHPPGVGGSGRPWIEPDRRAERAPRRQTGRLVALGRAHAAALDRQVDHLACGIGHQRLRVDHGLEQPRARDQLVDADRRVGERVAQPDPQLALRRVDLLALVDRAVERDHECDPVIELATHADPRVLQLEAVVAPDERDVGIVLDRDVLRAEIAERLPREPRLGRRRLGGRRRRSDRVRERGRWTQRGACEDGATHPDEHGRIGTTGGGQLAVAGRAVRRLRTDRPARRRRRAIPRRARGAAGSLPCRDGDRRGRARRRRSPPRLPRW
jgi:CBS domain-containing protein